MYSCATVPPRLPAVPLVEGGLLIEDARLALGVVSLIDCAFIDRTDMGDRMIRPCSSGLADIWDREAALRVEEPISPPSFWSRNDNACYQPSLTRGTSTYRHPKIMSLLIRCRELNISTRSRDNNTLPVQSGRLNIIIIDRPHTRNENYDQQMLSMNDIPLLEEDSEAEVLPGSSPLQYKVLVYG
jgi:hypothetical protein